MTKKLFRIISAHIIGVYYLITTKKSFGTTESSRWEKT
uniref:Uncharacterized protein n=1 Tax=Moniliophthora roreri TaxID=221103 RepID=A0A0W0FXL1_MONRR